MKHRVSFLECVCVCVFVCVQVMLTWRWFALCVWMC